MVDPDVIRAVQGDRITAPDILRVQLGEVHILDDNVADAADHAQALASDDALAANAHNALVRAHVDLLQRRLVVRARRPRIVAAPVQRVRVDRVLPGAAARVRVGDAARAVVALPGAPEVVEFPVYQDRARRVVRQPCGQLGDVAGRCGFSVAAACRASGIAEGLSGDPCGVGMAEKGDSCNEWFKHLEWSGQQNE